MEYEVEGSRGRGERLYRKDCQACILNGEDAVYRSRWKKLIKIG